MPITTRGKLYWLKVHEIPAGEPDRARQADRQPGAAGRGREAGRDPRRPRSFDENQFVFFVTRKGVVKKTDLNAFSNVRSAGIIALGIEDGDSLVAVYITDGTQGHPPLHRPGHEHPLPRERGPLDGPAAPTA